MWTPVLLGAGMGSIGFVHSFLIDWGFWDVGMSMMKLLVPHGMDWCKLPTVCMFSLIYGICKVGMLVCQEVAMTALSVILYIEGSPFNYL